MLTALTLPLIVVGGIFGMNNNDMPLEVPFRYTMIGDAIVYEL